MHFFPFGIDDDDFGGFSQGFGKPKPKKDIDNTTFYKILGVEKTATKDEIRKAYRTLIRTKHPDKGGDKDEFQKIQLAYDTLSDENKRKVYDDYGEEGLKEGMTEEPTSIFDIFGGGGKKM